MKLYVGITDEDWFNALKKQDCDEINFWKPGESSFKAIEPNEMFLFKLHAPKNYIVGGGFFVRYSSLPINLAWEAFGEKNGVSSYNELNQKIHKYRSRNNMITVNPQIGCVILTEPFFFEEYEWIPVPSDWNRSIVQGKTYDTETEMGAQLLADVLSRINKSSFIPNDENPKRYIEGLTRHRLGQGAFRISVTEAYERRCAISGEKTLPVLQAAHILPYAEGGEHIVKNGLLLRSDIHTLFDDGYITIDADYRIHVSDRLHNDYGNGKDYYKFNGEKLLIVPEKINERPSQEFLDWHKHNIYLG